MATSDIPAGSELTITYCSLLGSSVARREDIVTNWFFTCTCDRCSHSDDRGANLDSWMCGEPDCGGLLTPENTARPNFVCGDCSQTVDHQHILEKEKLIQHSLDVSFWKIGSKSNLFIQKIAEETGDCQENYEKFISDNQSELHDNHWMNTQARISILNGADFNTQDPPRIENLSSHCRSDIKVNNVSFSFCILGN